MVIHRDAHQLSRSNRLRTFTLGTIGIHRPVMLIAAVTSQYEDAFDWGIRQSETAWGGIWQASDRFEFTETSYYEKSMGSQLRKQFACGEMALQ